MKKAITKAGFLLYFILLHGLPGFSQIADSSYLEYAGRPGGLGRLMLDEVSNAESLNDKDFYKIHHIYYEVQFRIDKTGKLGEQITINSVNDTSLRASILQAMKKTQGHWINHARKELLVILPIHLYIDSDDSMFTDCTMNILPLWHASYNRWEESKILYLTTIEIKSGPLVHKTSFKKGTGDQRIQPSNRQIITITGEGNLL